jgi:translocation and assembly module TamB
MDLQMQARSLRVTNRADRRLSLSGQVRAQLTQGRMRLSGTLEADSAQFVLTDDNTPTLGKDVLIVQPRQVTAAAKTPQGLSVMGVPDVQVLLRLGPDFRLRGQGIDTRLAGEVQLASNEGTAGQPRLAGQVRTEGGLYRAYGQQLEIEQGLLQFTGAYDNPSLDILALRPNLGQRVGVRVSGTALAPRVRLYADPDLPDADKLAWLVLGRSPATGGTESAVLQQAALTLLGGNGKRLGGELAVALGVDDISLANRSATTAAGTTATGTAVMLGKRLSRDFYLAYESSISGAFGNLFIFYDLSRKLTLRAQAGEFNALDLVYTIRHD